MAFTLVIGACGSHNTTSLDVREDNGSGLAAGAARPLSAGGLSFQVADAQTTRVTPDGITLGVQAHYFEPARFEDWVAPAECAFNTQVDIEVEGRLVSSPPFEGPVATDDQQGRGLLGTLLPVTDPGTGEPALLALVVAFGHDATVTMTVDGLSPSGAGSDESTPGGSAPDGTAPDGTAPLDTQPADGWTSLGLLVPGSEAGGAERDVTINWQDVQGATATESLTLPAFDPDEGLTVLNPEWVFDELSLGEQCEPPVPTDVPDNQPRPVETDILSAPISEKPTLPESGEPPADVPEATAAVLQSIRAVYDLNDLYGLDKADHVEDPAIAVVILEEAQDNEVVEPYLSQLDPEFDSVVFLSPTEAAVLYRVGPGYQWEIGRVLLIDGSWRVGLGSICRDLADALYTCPNVTPDPGPGPLG